VTGFRQALPGEELARVVLAIGGGVGVAQDTRIRNGPPRADVGDEVDQGLDLRVGEGAIAELVARIDDLDADGDGVDVGLALPEALSGMPGAAFLRNQGEDAAVFLDHVVGADLGLRVAHAFERHLARGHAGVVQDDHVRRRRAGVEVGRRRLDEAHWTRFRTASSNGITLLRRRAMISTPNNASAAPKAIRASK